MQPPEPRAGFLKRYLPHPLLSLLLAMVWLLLQQSLAPAQWLVALCIGVGLPLWLPNWTGAWPWPRRWRTVIRLAWVVLGDVLRSNISVAWLVLNPWSRPQPAWLHVPLDTRHPTAVMLLATIITTTPGTLSCVVDEQAGSIWVHALDCSDAAAMVTEIKLRYERPLKEIFEP